MDSCSCLRTYIRGWYRSVFRYFEIRENVGTRAGRDYALMSFRTAGMKVGDKIRTNGERAILKMELGAERQCVLLQGYRKGEDDVSK